MKKHRLWGLLTALALAVSMFAFLPEGAFEAYAVSGSGTKADPYLAADYDTLRELLDADFDEVYIKLGATIYRADANDNYMLSTYSNSRTCVYHVDLNGHTLQRDSGTADRAIFSAGKKHHPDIRRLRRRGYCDKRHLRLFGGE